MAPQECEFVDRQLLEATQHSSATPNSEEPLDGRNVELVRLYALPPNERTSEMRGNTDCRCGRSDASWPRYLPLSDGFPWAQQPSEGAGCIGTAVTRTCTHKICDVRTCIDHSAMRFLTRSGDGFGARDKVAARYISRDASPG